MPMKKNQMKIPNKKSKIMQVAILRPNHLGVVMSRRVRLVI